MRSTRAITWLYFIGLAGLIVLILTRLLPDLLPAGAASQIGRNSEGLALVLGVSLWIWLARPRLAVSRLQWPLTAAVVVILIFAGFLLRQGPWPIHVVTLNEAVFALAVLVGYLQLPRPLPTGTWALLPLAAIVIPAVGGHNTLTTDLAETFGALVVIPLCVDLVDRGILDGSAVPVIRVLVWMAILAALVVILHTIVDRTPDGVIEEVVRYVSRATEMYLAGIILHGFFSLAVGQDRDRRRPATAPN